MFRPVHEFHMEYPILITWLNDYVFCPLSIYFHNLYGEKNSISYQDIKQINGTEAHKTIDSGTYSTRSSLLCGISVFCEKYNLTGKIDIFNIASGELCERKKHITQIYDGYIFQLYGQYFSLKEMGFSVKSLVLRSLDNNKSYSVSLPESDLDMFGKFEKMIDAINNFNLGAFKQTNRKKCEKCIYEPLCGSSIL